MEGKRNLSSFDCLKKHLIKLPRTDTPFGRIISLFRHYVEITRRFQASNESRCKGYLFSVKRIRKGYILCQNDTQMGYRGRKVGLSLPVLTFVQYPLGALLFENRSVLNPYLKVNQVFFIANFLSLFTFTRPITLIKLHNIQF